MPLQGDLSTIRALSQYRPFEGQGESARDAQEDLVLAALAEADGHVESIARCKEDISTLFGLTLEEVAVAAALGRLVERGAAEKVSDGFRLAEPELTRLKATASQSQEIARVALDEWQDMLAERWPLTTVELELLEESLRVYLKTVMWRHGVEASLLLYPESQEALALYDELEAEGFDFLPPIENELKEPRDFALSYFLRRPTDAQRAYLAQNLNTAYFLTALSIDPEGARLVQEIAHGQRVYVDTNFVYRLLGVQGPRYVKPAEAILQATLDAGYGICVTPWTIAEFKQSLKNSRDFLTRYPVPPSEYAAIAAEATSHDNFVTAYWRRVRNGPLRISDFVEKYEEVETLLTDREIDIESEGCTTVGQMTEAIKDDMSILEKAVHGRERHPALIEHDVKHRLLVRRLRKEGVRNFSNAGYWFLTHDTVLPRYDHMATRGTGELAFCVSAGSWFQIVDAFRPKTEDPEQSLADMLASPYVRYRRTLSQEAALSIVARVHEYADGSPELAARIMMNSAAVHEIDNAPNEEARHEKIDSAILEAAKRAQEEARQDKEVARKERERADEIERKAQELLREANTEYKDELGRTKLLGEEAVRLEQERAARAIKGAEAQHKKEIADLAERMAEKDRKLWRARRRLFRLIAFISAVVVFLLLDLAVGLESTWSVLVAAATLLAIGLPLNAWATRRAGSVD
jgi:predicted nucleic acid-binding protein